MNLPKSLMYMEGVRLANCLGLCIWDYYPSVLEKLIGLSMSMIMSVGVTSGWPHTTNFNHVLLKII